MKNRILSSCVLGALLFGLPVAHAQTAEKTCWGGPPSTATLEQHVRKEEGFRLSTEMLSKLIDALDKVLLSEGPGDNNFDDNVNFVLSHQFDQKNMGLVIESSKMGNAEAFRARWAALAGVFKYRKRFISNWIVEDYKDVNCLREIRVHGVGSSFSVLDDDVKLPSGFRTARNSLDFDRFTISFREISPEQFRVVDMIQFTESVYPLPEGAGLLPGRSPFLKDAPGNFSPVSSK